MDVNDGHHISDRILQTQESKRERGFVTLLFSDWLDFLWLRYMQRKHRLPQQQGSERMKSGRYQRRFKIQETVVNSTQ